MRTDDSFILSKPSLDLLLFFPTLDSFRRVGVINPFPDIPELGTYFLRFGKDNMLAYVVGVGQLLCLGGFIPSKLIDKLEEVVGLGMEVCLSFSGQVGKMAIAVPTPAVGEAGKDGFGERVEFGELRIGHEGVADILVADGEGFGLV